MNRKKDLYYFFNNNNKQFRNHVRKPTMDHEILLYMDTHTHINDTKRGKFPLDIQIDLIILKFLQ